MPATQMRKELRAFCYEHHLEMRLSPSLAGSSEATAETYACAGPDCLVQYNTARGYFLLSQEGTHEMDMVPNVRCLHDGTSMYLAELAPDKPSFRLWICPHCDARRTNEEGLIGLGRDEMQNDPGESRARS